MTFNNNSCFIMLNGVLYFVGTLCNGIYILDMSNSVKLEKNKFFLKHGKTVNCRNSTIENLKIF